jgi:hypothetical protein
MSKRFVVNASDGTTGQDDLTPQEEADRSATAQAAAARQARADTTVTARTALRARARAGGPVTAADLRLIIQAFGDDPDAQ